uniref:Uncharacterized protein n=1 Tax=Plectus sambesii TaxID=2011161 RepID=A0A914UJ86_9BILA
MASRKNVHCDQGLIVEEHQQMSVGHPMVSAGTRQTKRSMQLTSLAEIGVSLALDYLPSENKIDTATRVGSRQSYPRCFPRSSFAFLSPAVRSVCIYARFYLMISDPAYPASVQLCLLEYPRCGH